MAIGVLLIRGMDFATTFHSYVPIAGGVGRAALVGRVAFSVARKKRGSNQIVFCG
jgi:hypothetical protein